MTLTLNQQEKFDNLMNKIGYEFEDLYYGDWLYVNKLGKEIRIVICNDTIYGVIVNDSKEFGMNHIKTVNQLYTKIVNTLNKIGQEKKTDEFIKLFETKTKRTI